MQKVLSRARPEPYDGLVNDLHRIFESEVNPSLEDVRRMGGEYLAKLSHTSDADWLSRKTDVVKPAWNMEIKLMALDVMKGNQDADRRVTSLTIQNSNVGVVQTGDRSAVVGTSISFTTEEKAQLTEALQDLRDRLENVQSLSGESRAELHEVALDVEKELAKDKPNTTKLRGLLSMILAGIKGIGSLVTVYKVVETVLQSHGVHLLG